MNRDLASLQDVVPYTDPRFPFTEAFAQFAIGFDHPGPMGLGVLLPRAGRLSAPILNPALSLWMEMDGNLGAVMRRTHTSLPWKFVESGLWQGDVSNVEIQAEHVFVDPSLFISHFVFRNTSAESVSFRLHWTGFAPLHFRDIPGVDNNGLGSKANARIYCQGERETGIVVEKDGAGANALSIQVQVEPFQDGCRSHVTAYPLAPRDPGDSNESSMAVPGYYTIYTDEPVVLNSGEDRAFTFGVALSLQEGKVHSTLPDRHLWGIPWEVARRSAETRFTGLMNLGEWPGSGRADPQRHALLRARFFLLRDCVQRSKGCSVCDTSDSDVVAGNPFILNLHHDEFFHAAAMASFQPDIAKDLVRYSLASARTSLDSESGDSGSNASIDNGPQNLAVSPIGAWSVLEIYRADGDRDFLSETFHALIDNHRYWMEQGDIDGDGLCEYPGCSFEDALSGSNENEKDFAGDFDEGHSQWIASVALNCLLHWDALHIAEIAHKLEREGLAADFKVRSQDLAETLWDICYHEKQHRFSDYDPVSRRHAAQNSITQFFPLMCGMPLPEPWVCEMVESVLLEPQQFFGPLPFPLLAYDDPARDKGCPWGKSLSPAVAYWLAQSLWHLGYERAAEVAVSRIVNALGYGGLQEQYVFQTASLSKEAARQFVWGTPVAYLLLSEHYKLPPHVYPVPGWSRNTGKLHDVSWTKR